MHYVLGAGWPGPSACRPAPTRHIIASSALEGFFGTLKCDFDRYIEWYRGGKLKKALGWRTIRQAREELAGA